MNDSIYRKQLDIHSTMSQATFQFKRNDSARQIIFGLSEDGHTYNIVDGCSAILRAKKHDGTVLFNDCEIEDNLITYTLTNQTTAEVGLIECELTLYGADSRQLCSPRFAFLIEDIVYDDHYIESTDEFTALSNAIAACINLDVAADKDENVVTITVTHKDGTTSSVSISEVRARGTWAQAIDDYLKNDIVYHNGSSYIATEDIEVGTDITDPAWQILVSKGDKGDSGFSMFTYSGNITLETPSVPKGSLSPSTRTPQVGDLVLGSNGGYARISTIIDWSEYLSVSFVGSLKGDKGDKGDTGATGEKGETGDTGAKGETGERGDDGADGEDGRGIVSITKTASVGNVDTYTITYTDGTTSTFEVRHGDLPPDLEAIDDIGVYLSRQSGGGKEIGNRELLNKIVGGTIVWNQQNLGTGADTVIPIGHIFYTSQAILSGNYIQRAETDSYPCGPEDVFIDLTQMFGTDIAEYIYTLDRAHAGDGVAFIKPFIENADKSYNAGELVSVKTSAHVTKDANAATLGTYPIDNVELRGKLKLDANNKLYHDGDEYTADGALTRKYGIVDLGTLTWQYRSAQNVFSLGAGRGFSKTNGNVVCTIYPQYVGNIANMPDMTVATFSAFNANDIVIKNSNYTNAAAFKSAMSGVYLVYELATQTTDSASPIPNPQIVDADGTEEFVDERDVPMPVQAEAKYLSKAMGEAIGDFLGTDIPRQPSSGTYLLKSVNGVMSWVEEEAL